MRPERIISGGQTGADRTGLEVARELGIPTGGWAPKGWRTATGPDPSLADFGLSEHENWDYRDRTYANAREADGTVWFGLKSPGYWCTATGVRKAKRVWIENPTGEQLRNFVRDNNIKVLNVAGNRLHKNKGVVEQVRKVLTEAFGE